MSAAGTAVTTLRRCLAALASPLTADDRERVAAMATASLQLLEADGRRRVSAERLAVRVQQLEAALRDRDPGERRRIITERLGISRSSYFRAKSQSRETARR